MILLMAMMRMIKMSLENLKDEIEALKTKVERLEAQYHYAVDLAEKLQKRITKAEKEIRLLLRNLK